MNIRQITNKDQLDLKKVYFESINSIDESVYNQEQKRAWSSQVWENSNFEKTLSKGKGWLVYENGIIIAFALRYPKNRISLLYCRGNYQRKGYGTKLLKKIEDDVLREGLNSLSTEASLISYELFLKHNWEIVRKEKIIIKDIIFERYNMKKNFSNSD